MEQKILLRIRDYQRIFLTKMVINLQNIVKDLHVFYEHKVYKHMNPQNCLKIKDIVSLIFHTRGRVWCFQNLRKKRTIVNCNMLKSLLR